MKTLLLFLLYLNKRQQRQQKVSLKKMNSRSFNLPCCLSQRQDNYKYFGKLSTFWCIGVIQRQGPYSRFSWKLIFLSLGWALIWGGRKFGLGVYSYLIRCSTSDKCWLPMNPPPAPSPIIHKGTKNNDKLESVPTLKICLVLISVSAIANHDVIIRGTPSFIAPRGFAARFPGFLLQ